MIQSLWQPVLRCPHLAYLYTDEDLSRSELRLSFPTSHGALAEFDRSLVLYSQPFSFSSSSYSVKKLILIQSGPTWPNLNSY